jgi:hypothetical protein
MTPDERDALYQAICAYVMETGMMPTIKAIANQTALSKSWVWEQWQRLVNVGLIQQPRKGYGYKLPDDVMISLLIKRSEKGSK